MLFCALDCGAVACQGRLRVSHISAHLVDGSFDQREGAWRDARTPRVYSREFIELVMALEFLETHRVYLGMQYIYHVDPPVLGSTAFQAGGEAMVSPGGMMWLHAYVAYDLKLTKFTAWTASHSVQAGVKLGRRNGAGVNLFIAAFNGTSQHGEYYDQRWSYWGPGFSVEF